MTSRPCQAKETINSTRFILSLSICYNIGWNLQFSVAYCVGSNPLSPFQVEKLKMDVGKRSSEHQRKAKEKSVDIKRMQDLERQVITQTNKLTYPTCYTPSPPPPAPVSSVLKSFSVSTGQRAGADTKTQKPKLPACSDLRCSHSG